MSRDWNNFFKPMDFYEKIKPETGYGSSAFITPNAAAHIANQILRDEISKLPLIPIDDEIVGGTEKKRARIIEVGE